MIRDDRLPQWVAWQQRPFPNANLLLLTGRESTLIDSGFVGHAEDTAAWVAAKNTGTLARVLNTHWHSDHVGGNSLLQRAGAAIAASAVDAEMVARRDPGCCLAEYLDQPVAPYTVDQHLADQQVLRLGDADWIVIETPGHTPGHIAIWQPEERLLAVGDSMSAYDVGWVNLAVDGPDAAPTALASLERLAALQPRVLLPAHGPIPRDTTRALEEAVTRAARLVHDPASAVWYGARRVLAFALMLKGGIRVAEYGPYMLARAWVRDAAGLLGMRPAALSTALLTRMIRSGAVTVRDGRIHASAHHVPVTAQSLALPFPREWASQDVGEG